MRVSTEIIRFRELPSTQDYARAEWTAGRLGPGPAAVVADRQLKGRGTHGREWHSPLGGLWITVATARSVSPTPARVAGQVALVVLHAIQRTLRLDPADTARLAIKWPNDLMADGQKFGGLLIEDVSGPAGPGRLVGLGVNASFDAGLVRDRTEWPATTLRSAFHRPILLATLEAALIEAIASFREDAPGWMEAVSARLWGRGGRVVITGTPAERLEGEPMGVDEHGGLVLRIDGLTQSVRRGRIASVASAARS